MRNCECNQPQTSATFATSPYGVTIVRVTGPFTVTNVLPTGGLLASFSISRPSASITEDAVVEIFSPLQSPERMRFNLPPGEYAISGHATLSGDIAEVPWGNNHSR